MKSGIQTSEFWLTVISTLGGLFLSTAPGNTWTQLAGAALMAVTSGSYTMGRSLAKGKAESVQSRSRVMAEALLKKDLFDPK